MKTSIFLLVALISGLMGLTVYDVQYSDSGPSPWFGETVEVTGVVTATAYDGDKWFMSDAEGGPWHGVYVFDWDHTVTPGEIVTMTCEVDEYYDFTELKNISAFVSEPGGTVPAPHFVSCMEANSESMEGVLVTLEDVVVDSVISGGQWYISDGTATLKVANHFDYDLIPDEGAELPGITGIIIYSWDTYTLEPRFDEDIDYEPAPPEFVTIHDIQYSAEGPSPYLDETVTVHGLVTATSFRGSNYFLSDPVSGPWNGLYVYDNTHEVNIGDWVTMTGEIDEYYDLTEFKNITDFSVDSTGGTVRSYHVSSLADAMQESMEAVLVTLPDVTISSLGEDDEWFITDGTTTMPVLDGFDTGYTPVTSTELHGLTGVVFYTYGEFKLNPRSLDDIESVDEKGMPQEIGISVYPNPFNSAIVLDGPATAEFQIYDCSGKLVARPEAGTWTPAEGTASGVYLLRVIESDGKETVRRISYIR